MSIPGVWPDEIEGGDLPGRVNKALSIAMAGLIEADAAGCREAGVALDNVRKALHGEPVSPADKLAFAVTEYIGSTLARGRLRVVRLFRSLET